MSENLAIKPRAVWRAEKPERQWKSQVIAELEVEVIQLGIISRETQGFTIFWALGVNDNQFVWVWLRRRGGKKRVCLFASRRIYSSVASITSEKIFEVSSSELAVSLRLLRS